jgi:formylglycine-generating enzyme required for sulfatase activity
VVGVSWYEAYAFTRWLTAKLGFEVRLPTESEWEKAARGIDGRIYPWGNEYTIGYANVDEVDSRAGLYCLQRTTAVGIYLQSASPYDVLDMSGNVGEWSATKWRWSYNELEDNDPEGDADRVLRGGSWRDGPDYARCAARSSDLPFGGDYDWGFRVMCSAPMP